MVASSLPLPTPERSSKNPSGPIKADFYFFSPNLVTRKKKAVRLYKTWRLFLMIFYSQIGSELEALFSMQSRFIHQQVGYPLRVR